MAQEDDNGGLEGHGIFNVTQVAKGATCRRADATGHQELQYTKIGNSTPKLNHAIYIPLLKHETCQFG